MDRFYPIVVMALNEEDGPGYIGVALDLKGCISHGDTPEEAFASTREAVLEWLDEAEANGRLIPNPGSARVNAQFQRDTYEKTIKELRDLLVRVQKDNVEVQAELLALKALLGTTNQDCVQDIWPAHLVGFGFHNKARMEDAN